MVQDSLSVSFRPEKKEEEKIPVTILTGATPCDAILLELAGRFYINLGMLTKSKCCAFEVSWVLERPRC